MKAGAAESATVEIAVHTAILFFILVPILTIVYPSMLLFVAATVSSNAVAAGSQATKWISNHPGIVYAMSCAIALACAATGAAWLRSHIDNPRVLAPSGPDGKRLQDVVADLWIRFGRGGSTPVVRWFPNTDLAGYATEREGVPEIHVSAGLWRAAISDSADNAAARAILAHELAHIVSSDPRRFRHLETVIVASRIVLLITAALGAAVVLLVLVFRSMDLRATGADLTQLALAWVQILACACIVLFILPLGWLTLRRQVSFITSLIEIRADIVGALNSSDLKHYVQLFSEGNRTVRSTRRNLLSALISPRFTHVPERQRLEILASPPLIVTPKLRFFALSLLLVFLIPVNFATPLLFGGFVDHLAMIALAISLNVAIVAMLLLGAPGQLVKVELSLARKLTLAAAACGVTALPLIDLVPVSYLFMSWFAGFGGPPMDFSTLPGEIATTATDVARPVKRVLLHPLTLASVAISAFSISMIVVAAKRMESTSISVCWVLPSVTAAFFTIVAGAGSRFPIGALGAIEQATTNIRPLLLCLPLFASALVALSLVIFMRPKVHSAAD